MSLRPRINRTLIAASLLALAYHYHTRYSQAWNSFGFDKGGESEPAQLSAVAIEETVILSNDDDPRAGSLSQYSATVNAAEYRSEWRRRMNILTGRSDLDQDDDNDEQQWDIPVCHFKNFCAQVRSEKDRWFDNTPRSIPKKLVTYAFASDRDVPNLASEDPDLATYFDQCMPTKYVKNVTLSAVNLDKYKGPVEWIRGNTFGFRKSEPQNHPGTWGRIWASLAAAAVYGTAIFNHNGVSSAQPFDHVQLFESPMDMNSYSALAMHSSMKVLQNALAKKERPASRGVHLFSTNKNIVDSDSVTKATFSEETYLYGEDKRLVCYENMFTVPESYDYFRSAEAAQAFRAAALEQVGLPVVRPRSCKRKNMKVTYLKRPERPVWNERAMLETLSRVGFSNIDTRIISDTTPAQEQVAIFYQADLIISAHGSQLQSQYFMQPKSGLIEMFPKNYIHWNQAALAQFTGIDHIEMIDNEFPEREVVAGQAPEMLSVLEKNLKNARKWSDPLTCGRHMECYQNARNLGVHVNIADLQKKLLDLAERLENSKGCLA